MKRNRFKSMTVCRHLLGSRDDRLTWTPSPWQASDQFGMSFLEEASQIPYNGLFVFLKRVILLWVRQRGARTRPEKKKVNKSKTHHRHWRRAAAAGRRRTPAGRWRVGGSRASWCRYRLDCHTRVDWDHRCLLKSGAKWCFSFPLSAPSLFLLPGDRRRGSCRVAATLRLRRVSQLCTATQSLVPPFWLVTLHHQVPAASVVGPSHNHFLLLEPLLSSPPSCICLQNLLAKQSG